MASHLKSLAAFALAVPVATLIPACGVPQEKFNDEVAKAEKAQSDFSSDEDLLKTSKKIIGDQKTAIAKSKADLDAKTKADNDQIAALGKQVSELQNSNKELTEASTAKKGELQQKVAELVKEKDALAQQMADLTKTSTTQIADLTTNLAHAQADKDALQREKDDALAKAKGERDSLEAGLKSQIEQGNVQLKEMKEGLSLNLGDKVLFRPGEADVNPAGKKVLDQIGGVVNNFKDKDLRIEGYTDSTPLGGSIKEKFGSNWELSAARATAVARYLQEKVDVDPKRLIVTGYGEFRPVAPNDTPENQAKNRHIEIVLVPHN